MSAFYKLYVPYTDPIASARLWYRQSHNIMSYVRSTIPRYVVSVHYWKTNGEGIKICGLPYGCNNLILEFLGLWLTNHRNSLFLSIIDDGFPALCIDISLSYAMVRVARKCRLQFGVIRLASISMLDVKRKAGG